MSKFKMVYSDEILEDAFFCIDKCYFYRCSDEDEQNIMEHNIEVDLGNEKQYLYNDIINILKDIDQSPIYTNIDPNAKNKKDEQDVYVKWITSFPKEEYEYIRDFESEIRNSDNVLFHDFMKKYIEICKVEDINIKYNIAFVGYTLIENILEIKIKTFNYKILKGISEKIIEQFSKHKFIIKSDNLNWTRLDEFIVGENSNFTCEGSDKLLNNTLKRPMNEIFECLFNEIDVKGYIDMAFIREKKIIDKKQLYGLLKPYLKLPISNNFIYLHDEPSIDLKDEKNNRVFSFSSRLMQYYQKQWFEDFVGKILEKIKKEHRRFNIKSTKRNKIFNFYKDDKKENNIEIDWIIDVEKDGVNRTIGIECKKTLKRKYYNETKNKVYNKVVRSSKAIIDGYIVIGYFKDVNFSNDMILSKKNEYKPEILFNENEYSDENVFVQYLAICDTDILNLKNKIIECIELIYRNS